MHDPSILRFHSSEIYSKLLNWHGHSIQPVGDLFRISGYDQFNFMIDLNSVWSKHPAFHPVDRTGQVKSPVRWHCRRPWQIPTHQATLSDAVSARVKNIADKQQRINIMWSGGIDSTTVITAFLQNLDNYSQLRVMYTPFSTYEHPEFIPFLQKNFNVELVDLSGTVYLDTQFDGIFVTGDGGDELMASLDQSFFEQHGPDILDQPWQDFFYNNNHSQELIDFCQVHFAQAGRPIDTVLEARWWFYTCFKNSSCLWIKLNYFSDYNNFDHNRLIGFFDCEEFETYIYYNIDKILGGEKYSTWKQPFKDYCYQHNSLRDWYFNKKKENGPQLSYYNGKKLALKNCRYLVKLTDNTNTNLPSLPFVSRQEYNENLYSILDPLFHVTV